MSTAPPWGCPFHGLIEGGELTLPNGEVVEMRQPGGMIFEQGNTSLIALPNAPGAVRTPEQQVDDVAKGMQWLDKAILAGDQIHGTGIGEGCWIYQDPAGANWHVSTQLQGLSGDTPGCQVTLKRFGVFGGEPESYTYTIDVTGINAAVSYFFLPSGAASARLFSVHPSGQAAVFAVYLSFSGRLRTGAFLEVMLSGPGAACTVGFNALYAASDVLGSQNSTGSIPNTSLYRISSTEVVSNTTVENFPDCSGTYRLEQTLGFEPAEGDNVFRAYPSGSFSETTLYEGMILAVLYKPDGEKMLMTLTVESAAQFSSGGIVTAESEPYVYSYQVISSGGACVRETIEHTQGVIRLRQTTQRNWQASMRIYADGVLVLEDSISQNATQTNEFKRTNGEVPGQPPPTTTPLNSNWITERSDGQVATYTGLIRGGTLTPFDLGSSDDNYRINSRNQLAISPSMGRGVSGNPVYMGVTSLHFARCSNAVYCMLTRSIPESGNFPETVSYTPAIATPAGEIEADALTVVRADENDSDPVPYASYNPITNEAARSFDGPICYT